MRKNFISVVVPAHNEENAIAKAINSVLSSTYKNYEIIVVNDGSADGTQQIVQDFIKKHPQRIRLLNYDEGHSPAFARNRGAEAAKGDVLFFLDADDWVTQRTLESIIKAFGTHKEVDFIAGNRKVFVPNTIERVFLYGVIARDEIELKLKGDELVTNDITPCPYIIKTHAFKKMGFFDENTYYVEDALFSKKLAQMRIKKLLTKKIEYYTDYRSTLKDFVKQCKNVGKGLSKPFVPAAFLRLLSEMLISVLIFPFFFVVMFAYFVKKTGDLALSFFAPFLYTLRRIIEMYYFLKFI
jgi:glycosyltransferase involved in cell wall biosynthesis